MLLTNGRSGRQQFLLLQPMGEEKSFFSAEQWKFKREKASNERNLTPCK
jgi:hypothetical protein